MDDHQELDQGPGHRDEPTWDISVGLAGVGGGGESLNARSARISERTEEIERFYREALVFHIRSTWKLLIGIVSGLALIIACYGVHLGISNLSAMQEVEREQSLAVAVEGRRQKGKEAQDKFNKILTDELRAISADLDEFESRIKRLEQ